MPARLRALRLLALPVLLATVLVATTWLVSAPAADASAARRIDKIHQATRIAANQKGDPYVYGAAGPNAFDCSGLTYYAYKKVGISLPRSSDAQIRPRARRSRRPVKTSRRIRSIIFSGSPMKRIDSSSRRSSRAW